MSLIFLIKQGSQKSFEHSGLVHWTADTEEIGIYLQDLHCRSARLEFGGMWFTLKGSTEVIGGLSTKSSGLWNWAAIKNLFKKLVLSRFNQWK